MTIICSSMHFISWTLWMEQGFQFWEVKHPCYSDLQWPQTYRPSTHVINIWKKALTSALYLGCNLSIEHSLGPWFTHDVRMVLQSSRILFMALPTIWLGTTWGHSDMTKAEIFHFTSQLYTPPTIRDLLEKAQIMICGNRIALQESAPRLQFIN